MAVKTYDPAGLTCIIAGKIFGGFADGTFLTISRNEDTWMYKSGVDGGGARAKNNNRSGRVVFTVLQTSDENDLLSALAIDDELTGTATFPIAIRDANGRSLFTALTAWIVKLPDAEFGKEVGTRAWTIETNSLEAFVGGNN